MDDKDKNAKKEPDEKAAVENPVETEKCKCGAHWKVIAGVVVLLIIVMNTFWNMTESKITETLAKEIGSFKTELKSELKSDLDNIDARISETEKGTIDLDAVKTDIASIKKAGEDFEKKLAAVIKAEEDKLTRLEKDVENQKAFISELKGLLEGATK